MEPRRLLVTGCPAYGHLLPMLPLVRAAERAGHEVRLATGPDMVAAMERRGLRVMAAGLSFPEMWASHDAALVGLEEAPPMEQAIAGGTGLFGATVPARRSPCPLCANSGHRATYSITSSARSSNGRGTVIPNAFAVLRLITSSYLVGACTGRLPGFSPLRMRST